MHSTSAAGRALLLNEVRLARQITHPAVCRVFDIGEEAGQTFLSMKFVEGEDLAALIHRRFLENAPADDRAVWFRFDNATSLSERIAETRGRSTELEAPKALPRHDGAFVRIELSSIDGLSPSWEKPISVFFRYQQGQWCLVGLERMPS